MHNTPPTPQEWTRRELRKVAIGVAIGIAILLVPIGLKVHGDQVAEQQEQERVAELQERAVDAFQNTLRLQELGR